MIAPRPFSAAILAGGQSSRLGYPKALLRLGTGRVLVEDLARRLESISDDVFIVANDPRIFVPGIPAWPDRIPGKAALGGILTAIEEARHDRVFVTACDMPYLSTVLVSALARIDGDVVVPTVEGRLQPLFGLYARRCAVAIRERLASDDLRVIGFFSSVDTRVVTEADVRLSDPDMASFRNMNTPEALREIYERLNGV